LPLWARIGCGVLAFIFTYVAVVTIYAARHITRKQVGLAVVSFVISLPLWRLAGVWLTRREK